MLEGRGGPNKANRSSLVADLGIAIGALGPEAKTAIGAPLRDFVSQLAEVSARLDRPQGARILALVVAALLERLSEAHVVRAAWRDAVATFQDDHAPATTCELRVRQLVELAEARGVDWDQCATTLEYILSDHAEALAQLGIIERQESGDDDGPNFARLPTEERIQLCEERLPTPATRSPVVVWLVLDNAAIRDGYLQIGPIEFFAASMVPDAIRPGGALSAEIPGFEAPPELATWKDVEAQFGALTPIEHRLDGRVRIADAPMGQARMRARRTLQAMIDIANPASGWIVLEGEASWREQGEWSGRSFAHPDTNRSRPVHVVFEPTAVKAV